MNPIDVSSYSRPDLAVVTHMDFDWILDFSRQVIRGCVSLTVDIVTAGNNILVLDSRELSIFSAASQTTGQKLDFSVGNFHEGLGSSLTVTLPSDVTKTDVIKIVYETSSKAAGLQWLNAKQTSSGKPFMFSQFQAIHARSAFPCQDSPSVKATYSAKVQSTVSDLQILMSGISQGMENTADGAIYKFSQPVPIPSYLTAVACGDLQGKKIGPRSTVWAEPDIVDKAAYEFAETETMLKTAESICGDYVWSIYDILVLPASFPYGGMENPNLTFVTPTLLAGDRSLSDVIAHEITHSWSGNLVTNSGWADFWLNEGFTMFIERKILGQMHGAKERHLDAALGWKALAECIKTRGAEDPMTILQPNVEGIDPDEAYTVVPYEKGHALLWYIESEIVGEDAMNSFLKSYIQKFAYQSITTSVFKDFLFEFFASKTKELELIDWDSWFHKPGMPAVELKFDKTLINCCSNLAEKWVAWNASEECDVQSEEFNNFSVNQKILFLSMLVEMKSLPIPKLRKMDELYKLAAYQNCEIRLLWLRLGLLSHWEESVKPALNFVNAYGRMKYTRPIYRDLYDWVDTRQQAINNFKEHESSMMLCSIQALRKDLHLG